VIALEIVEDLQAALEQFREVAADLGVEEALEAPSISEATRAAGEGS
jgi:hypothetical protein